MIGFVSQHGNIPKGYENRLRLVNGVSVQTTAYEDGSMEELRRLQNTHARNMTVKEFSEALGISKWTIYRWIKKERLKTYQRLPREKLLISIDALYESVWKEEP